MNSTDVMASMLFPLLSRERLAEFSNRETKEQIIAEYKLIQSKKSKLTKSKRDSFERAYNRMRREGEA